MSNGHCAAFAEVIEAKDVEKIVGKKAFAQVKRVLKKVDDNTVYGRDLVDYLDEGAEFLVDGHDFTEEFPKMAEVFKQKTGGLVLELRYHDTDEGDCYDEVEGLFFCVDFNSLYQLTPAGKKYSKKIERKFYVVYG